MTKLYTVYCDGASRKDGRGGWGAVIVSGTSVNNGARVEEIYGAETDTTNNRMELMGALESLWHLPAGSTVTVVSDSQYLVKGMQVYVHEWRVEWKKTSGEPLLNADLWKELLSATERHRSVVWQWVRGHNGDRYNERADTLAGLAIRTILGGT